MFKGECLNPGLSKLMCELGHTDKICISDAGLPIPINTERIDLAWIKNNPRWLDVCKLMQNNLNIEKIYLAKEIVDNNKEALESFKKIFEGIEIIYIEHSQLKEELKNCKGVIRTGEFSSFSNCILQIGVNFKESRK